ncbi:MAG: hypothetical protein WC734_00260 [Patescibacteria group bacterium]|jgi:hypothetical protein
MRNYGLFLVVLLVPCGVLFAPAMASCPEPPHWADGQEVARLNTISWEDDELSLTLKDGTSVSVPKDSCFVWVSEPGDVIFPERRQILGFYRDNTWYEVLETHLNMRPGEVPRPELPPTIRVTEETNTAELARKAGVPEWKFQQWNHANYTKPLLGEIFYMEEPLPGQYCERWSRFNGDPVGDRTPLNEQIYIFNRCRTPDDQIPDEVLQHWRSQSEASDGTLVTLYSTEEHRLFLDGLIMGGQNPGSEVKPWGRTYCDWVEAGTTTPVTQAEAYVYKPFVFGGYSWQLIKFKKCQNGAFIRIKLSEGELVSVPPKNEEVPPEETPTGVEETPPPENKIPEYSRDFYHRGVLWMDAINYHFKSKMADDWGDQYSFFAGGIIRFYPWGDRGLGRPFRQLAIVPRVALGYQGMTDSTKADFAGDYSLGLEARVLDKWGFQVFPQAGYGYTAAQRSWWEWESREDQGLDWKRQARFFDATWWYAMGRVVAPYETYTEGWVRNGKYLHDVSGYVTVEPSWFYARASYGRLLREKQSRHFDNTSLTMPADTMRVTQYRLGVKPWDGWVFYALYESQNYQSPVWGSISRGWGGGAEWRITESWRLKADTKRFGFHENTNKVLGVTDNGRKWESRIGADYRF